MSEDGGFDLDDAPAEVITLHYVCNYTTCVTTRRVPTCTLRVPYVYLRIPNVYLTRTYVYLRVPNVYLRVTAPRIADPPTQHFPKQPYHSP